MAERTPVWSLYMHVNKINGKVYIGITSRQPKKRWNNGNGYNYNIHFFNAIKKYGWENFDHIILAESEDQQLIKQCEIEGIQIANSTDPRYGYNISKGGDGFLIYTTQQQIDERDRKYKQYKKKQGADWYARNIDRVIQQRKKYYIQHAEQKREYCKKWYHDNSQYANKKSKEYRQQHKQEMSQYDSKYYVQHRQKILAYQDQYRKQHRQEINQYARQYRINNLQKRKQKDRRYYQQHKQQIHQKRRQKRLMMKNNTIQGGAVSNEQH